jgi:hypothetical protein
VRASGNILRKERSKSFELDCVRALNSVSGWNGPDPGQAYLVRVPDLLDTGFCDDQIQRDIRRMGINRLEAAEFEADADGTRMRLKSREGDVEVAGTVAEAEVQGVEADEGHHDDVGLNGNAEPRNGNAVDAEIHFRLGIPAQEFEWRATANNGRHGGDPAFRLQAAHQAAEVDLALKRQIRAEILGREAFKSLFEKAEDLQTRAFVFFRRNLLALPDKAGACFTTPRCNVHND